MHNPLSYWSWHGRTNRARFLVAVYAFGVIVLMFAPATLPSFWLEGPRPSTLGGAIFSLSVIIVTTACAWLLCLAPAIRRLHDRDRSGWWLVAYYVLPTAYSKVIQSQLAPGIALHVLEIPTLAVAIWAFVDMWCLRGTIGDNRFGPDPLAWRNAPAAAPA